MGNDVSAPVARTSNRTEAFSAIPRPQADSGDFRDELMHGVGEEQPPSARLSFAPDGNFVENFARPGAAIEQPVPNQANTTTLDEATVDAAKAAAEAARWPLEKYASVCARIERAPHKQQLIWSQYGVVGKHMVRVLSYWRKRFVAEPALEAEWRALVDAELRGDG